MKGGQAVLPLENPRETAVLLLAGFAGFGAAAVNLAISSSLFVAGGVPGHQWPMPLAAAAAMWGVALLGWTVAALRNGSFPLPGWSAVLLAAAAAVHLLAIVTGASGNMAGLNVSHLAALLLTLTIIAARGWLRRQTPGRMDDGGLPGTGSAAGASGAGRMLAAAFAGALAVAAIATPGLAASTAGQFAVPHGSHSDGGAGGHHGPRPPRSAHCGKAAE
jgi:hypothetical protein